MSPGVERRGRWGDSKELSVVALETSQARLLLPGLPLPCQPNLEG